MAKKSISDISFIDIAYSVAGKVVPTSIIQLFIGLRRELLTETERDVLGCMLSTYKEDGIFPSYDYLVKRYKLDGNRVCKSTADINAALRELLDKRQAQLMSLELDDAKLDASSTKEIKDRLSKIQEKYKTPTSVTAERFKSVKNIYLAEKLLPKGLTFGMSCIDEKTAGMQPGTVGALAGYVTEGKSTLTNNMLYMNALAGKKVAVCSLEIPKQLCHYIFLSRHSKQLNKMPLMYQALIRKDLSGTEEEYLCNDVDQNFMETVGKNLLVLDSGDITSYSKEGFVELYRMAEETLGGLDLFAWDHVNRFLYVNPGSFMTGNHYVQMLTDCTATYRNKEGGLVSTIFAVQCNREGWKKARRNGGSYDLTALSDFNEVERSCTYVIFVYADEVMRSANNALIQLKKHRIGEVMLAPETVDVFYAYSSVERDFKDTISNLSVSREMDMLQSLIGSSKEIVSISGESKMVDPNLDFKL